MFFGYGLSRIFRFSEADSRSILFETGISNAALSAILALNYIDSMAAIPAVLNMVANLSLGAFISVIFARYRPLSANL